MDPVFRFALRDASPDDLDALAALWLDGWRDGHDGLLPPALARFRTYESFRARLAEGLSALRVADGPLAPAGFCMIKGDELYQLYVSREARGTGVAAALLDDGEARIAASGVSCAWLACAIGNDRAARFYEKRGWRRAGIVTNELETPDGPFHLDIWRYEKPLRAAAIR